MRRLAILSATLVATTTIGIVGLGGVAGAATIHFKPGTVWTEEAVAGGCEIWTVHSGFTFTADLDGDSGAYTGGAKHVTGIWTHGPSAGATFSGTWNGTKKEYVVSFGGEGTGHTGQIVKGVVSSWDGVSC
jgi:hypothetical protein